jgi:gas vesicle protein
MNNRAKILAAIAAGAAVGVILGILIAPDEGAQTRKKIGKEGKKLADELKYRIRRGKEQLGDLTAGAEKAIQEKISELV